MLDIILATRDIYFEKALREIFGIVSSRIRYIEDAISDRRRVQSGRSFRYYFVFCDDEYTDIVRILFTGEACCILNKSMLNLRAAGGVLTLEERRAVLNRWICPYISRHLLSLNPLLACCRRYSRGER